MASYASPRKGKQIFIRTFIDEILHIREGNCHISCRCIFHRRMSHRGHTLTVKYELLKFNLHQFSTYLEKKALKSG